MKPLALERDSVVERGGLSPPNFFLAVSLLNVYDFGDGPSIAGKTKKLKYNISYCLL
jgi:hypothetical protein